MSATYSAVFIWFSSFYQELICSGSIGKQENFSQQPLKTSDLKKQFEHPTAKQILTMTLQNYSPLENGRNVQYTSDTRYKAHVIYTRLYAETNTLVH